MSAEEWRAIPEWAGIYEASDLGQVRSLPRLVAHYKGGMRQLPGCVLKQVVSDSGYANVNLSRDNKPRRQFVHRLVAYAFLGPKPDGMEICHGDGDRLNNALSNLRWDSHSANMMDAVAARTHHLSRRTHCPRGHSLSAPNLSAASARLGRRKCLACQRAYARAQKNGLRGLSFKAMSDEIYMDILQGVAA